MARPHPQALPNAVTENEPEAHDLAQWLAGETAGQCGPCVHGLAAIATATSDVCVGRAGDDTLARLRRWGDQIEGRGACRFPDGAVRLLRSALEVFSAEIDRHLHAGGCHAGPSVLPLPSTKGQSWR